VLLHLEKDARLFFSSTPKSYTPVVKVRWEGTVCYNYSPLIYGYRLKNIGITGEGTIDGNGMGWSQSWRAKQKSDQARLRQMGSERVPEDERIFGEGHFLRPCLIEFFECENIVLSGITVRNSPFWSVHPVFCKNVVI